MSAVQAARRRLRSERNMQKTKMLSRGSSLLFALVAPQLSQDFWQVMKARLEKSKSRECDIHVPIICTTFRSVTLEPTVIDHDPCP